MIVGIVFVIFGILIVAYPQLLSMMVAAFVIMVGVALISISYHFKKGRREADNPFVDFFMRY